MSRFALKTRSWRSAELPRPRSAAIPSQLPLRPELARVGLEVAHRPPDELGDRRADPAPRREVHHRGVEPVAGREPLVLGREDPVVGRDLLARVVALAQLLDERLAVRRDRDRVVEARDGVADAHLDRPPLRVRADVPPDVRVVGDAARALELPDDRGVVLVVAEARRRARAREGGEHDLPARGEAGRLAAPERRARRQREERRELGEEPVDDLDRLVGVVHRDVDVHAEDELAPRDVLELVDERVVAVLRGDPLALEEAERVRARRADAEALVAGDVADVTAERRELAHDVARGAADGCRDLEDGLHQLGVQPARELVALDRVEHHLDVLDEVETLRVEEHVLLLDAERVRVAGAEPVVEDTRVRVDETGDRVRDDLLHGSVASTSISTFHAGSSRAVTTHVAAGRTSRNASPWARATSSQCSGAVT